MATRMYGARTWHRDDATKQQVTLREKLTASRHAKQQSLPEVRKNKEQQEVRRVCTHWMAGKCAYGGNCRYLHSWVLGENLVARIAQLGGHKKAATGIALPCRSDKLFTGSSDGTLRLWDCNTGKCDVNGNVFNMGIEVGCS